MKNRSKRSEGTSSEKQHKMPDAPETIRVGYKGSGKLKDKVALITGGDSGIGRAVAVHFAREGAHVAIIYLKEHIDAKETKALVEAEGRLCMLLTGDAGDPGFCKKAVASILNKFNKIDILVNNCAEQHPQEEVTEISNKQLKRTFQTNIFSIFFITQAVVKQMKQGSAIINSTSVTAYRGSDHLIDYASTKGAILAFTRSLSANLVEKGIRVNGVAPGPIWTPLIISTFKPKEIKKFGKDQPMKRPGQPSEVAPCFVFLASDDSSYMTGQVLHPNGGEIVGG